MTRTLASLPLALLLLLAPARAAELTGGPLVGATDHATSRLWARTDGPGEVVFRIRPAAAPDARWQEVATRTRDDADNTAVALVEGLAPGTEYAYEVLVDGRPAPGGPWSFRTLPAPGTGRVTLAFGSCVNMARQPEQPIFDAVAAAGPSAFVFLGDNSYYDREDVKDPVRMWARVREQRENPGLRRLIGSTPVFAQWDDHDYGPNDSDRTYALKGVARDIFVAYFPNPSAGEGGEGIYTRASLGPVDLFLLDNRWFRDPNRQPNSPDKTLLGARQREWLLEGLAASTAPIKVVATANQFLARYHAFESWQLARDEREAILDGIRDRGVRGVLFVSGDRHLAEVVRWPADRVGYELWDVTSSPLANTSFQRGGDVSNPDRVFIYGAGNNFGWIEVDADARTVRLELRDEKGETLWAASPEGLFQPAGQAPAPATPGRRAF